MRWGSRTAFRTVCGCGALAAAIALPASSAAGPPAAVRVGHAPLEAHGARVVGALAASVPMHVTVVLKPRDPSALAAYADAVSTPGSGVFHQYLTPAQFGTRFGATQSATEAVSASLRARGLRPGAVAPNRLSISVTASAGQVAQAFSVSFRRLALPGGARATVASAAPALDPSITPYVQAVLGLSSTDTLHPEYRRAILGGRRRSALTHSARHTATGGPQPCAQASASGQQQSAYTADQIASAYGFSSLYQAGDQGQGQTIAIYELESDDPNDIAAYQSCYGTHASVSYIPVDGGAGSGAGSGEAALDIENAIGLAPRASFLVYQGANSNSSAPGSGPYDTFSAIIGQDRAQVVSVSWGECEPDNPDGLQPESTLFEEAATQGQTIIAASGDEGSEDCDAPPPSVPDLSLAVDDPSSQQFVTGVGGTTLSSVGPPPSESVWDNGAFASLAGSGGAGGGGISQMWSMPPYQSDAAAGLHVINSNSSATPCGASSGDCREVPDVSMNADPNTGYIVYWNGSRSDLTAPSGWQSIGGTSAAAPVWAALIADINASSGCHSSIGFANPALYRAASTSYGSTFHDITSGNNDLSGTNGGLFPAGSGYDMASGLGTPIGGGLAASLCSAAPRIVNPGSQRSTAGRRVSLQLKLAGTAIGSLAWKASHLPPGLSISSTSGRITGAPRRGGSYSPVVTATYQGAPLRQVQFSWTVTGGPTISQLSLHGVRSGRPTLAMTVSRGYRAASLRSVTVALPTGLRFGGRGGSTRVTGARGKRVRFSSRVVAGRLELRFSSPQPKVVLKLGGISLAPGFAGRVRGRHVGTLVVTLSATDASRHTTSISARVKPR